MDKFGFILGLAICGLSAVIFVLGLVIVFGSSGLFEK